MNLFAIFYEIGLHLLALLSLPKLLFNYKKYKTSFLNRLGKDFPQINKQDRQLIWIHAVSVGETEAIVPLIKRLKALNKNPLILLSTVTQTGRQTGLKRAPEADFHVFLPFDFCYIIRKIVKSAKPDLLILSETDFWYNFQAAAKKNGAQICLVNGKLSERSYNRFKRLPFLTKHLLHPIDHFCPQSEHYYTRFQNLKIPSSKLTLTGNLKLDQIPPKDEINALKKRLGLSNQPVLTLGSTHDPEEKIWLKALPQLWKSFPTLKVLLVPRHPERFNLVAKLIESASLPYACFSQNGTLETCSILLVDAMGVLKQCYQLADITFVGGSFTSKVGGHNIIEPAFYGKPVLFGPYMHSQPELLELVLGYRSGLQIEPNQINSTLSDLLSNPRYLQELGSNGEKLISESSGALDKTFSYLLPLLQKRGLC